MEDNSMNMRLARIAAGLSPGAPDTSRARAVKDGTKLLSESGTNWFDVLALVATDPRKHDLIHALHAVGRTYRTHRGRSIRATHDWLIKHRLELRPELRAELDTLKRKRHRDGLYTFDECRLIGRAAHSLRCEGSLMCMCPECKLNKGVPA